MSRLLASVRPGLRTSGSPAHAQPPRAGLLTVLCAPMFLVLLDVLAMNVTMPVLGRTFGVAPASVLPSAGRWRATR